MTKNAQLAADIEREVLEYVQSHVLGVHSAGSDDILERTRELIVERTGCQPVNLRYEQHGRVIAWDGYEVTVVKGVIQ